MDKQVLFIHGEGDNGFEADKPLVAALQEHLGNEYAVHYQEIKADESLPDYGWLKQIKKQLNAIKDDFFF